MTKCNDLPNRFMLLLAITVCLFLGLSLTANAQSRGGSTHAWYQVDAPQVFACYGILKNYHVQSVKNTVDQQLLAMYNNGQRKIRIPIFFVHEPQEANPGAECYNRPAGQQGMYMDSRVTEFDFGEAGWQYLKNLGDYLTTAKNIAGPGVGFEEFFIMMSPGGPNWQGSWLTFDWDYYAENWNVIVRVRQKLAETNTWYRIDLCNECLHNPTNYWAAYAYASELWGDYAGTYGRNDTVGFSLPSVSEANHVNAALDIYDSWGYGRPFLFAVHIYDDAYNRFVNFHNAFAARGETAAGLIIGETFYNDVNNSLAIRTAANNTGRLVHYLLQWPLNRNSSAQDVDQAPVNDFGNYITYGW